MFTGLDPQAVMPEAAHDEAIRMPLPLSVDTFAELVKRRGYRTAALVDHPGIRPWGNFDQGFDSYTMLYEEGAPGGRGWAKSDIDHVAAQFGARIDDDPETPFLIYLHVVYPHRPYTPMGDYGGLFGPDGYDEYVPEQRELLVNAYDAEVKRTDDLVALLNDALAARDLADDTWIIFTSDHGEGFWEHGFAEHGNVFYDEMIKVPLILVPPQGDLAMPARLDTPVSNLDVFATILDIASVEPPVGSDGRSLLDPETWSDATRSLFSESPHKYDIHGRAIIRDGIKYMHYPGRPAGERDFLFDLRRDPREQTNLFGARPDLQAGLQDILQEHRQLAASELDRLTQTTVEPDEETLERLRALGYIR
jgi:arylsulfatase